MKARQILILTISILLLFSSVSYALTAPSLNALAVSSSQINLTWNDPNKSETGYSIERSTGNGFTVIATTGKNATSYTDTGLTAGTTYNYRIRAFKSNVVSSYSNIASATTHSSDTTAPTVSISSPTSGTTYTTAQTVTITASASDNVGVTKVEFYQNGVLRSTDTTSPYTHSWSITASDNGTHSWAARAYDGAGNSTLSSSISLTVNISSDTTPPTGSVTINSNATYTNSTSVTLNLSASDASGVSQMCISNSTSCSTWEAYTTSKAWTLPTGDGTKTVYAWYRDGAGNTSPSYSDSIVLDATAPSFPTGLTAIAASCSQIDLTWTASSDTGSGIKGYNVYRNSVFIKQVTTTSTSDTGLNASTSYSYNVTAVDNAGNQSAMSSTAVASTPACTVTGGQYLWAQNIGGTVSSDSAYGNSVITDANGNVVVVGRFSGIVDFGGGYLSSAGGDDVFIAKYSPKGSHLWSKRLGGSSSENARSVAVDSQGNIIITGDFSNTSDLGGGSLTSAGWTDIFIAKYSPNGEHLWSKRFGSTNTDISSAVSVDINDNIIVAGQFAGSVDFGGGILTSAGGFDIFIAKYSPTGSHLWSKRHGGINSDYVNALAVDISGNIAITGYFSGSASFGGDQITSAGDRDIFVARYSATGTHLWSKGYGGSGYDVGEGIAVDGDSNIIVTGVFSGSVNFGGSTLLSNGTADMFIAKYSPTGAHIWSKNFGSSATYDITPRSVTSDYNGNILVTGTFADAVSFGGDYLFANQSYDIFIVKFTPTASHLWSKRFGVLWDDTGKSVVTDRTGNVFLVGDFYEAVDLGGGMLYSPGGMNTFVVKFSP